MIYVEFCVFPQFWINILHYKPTNNKGIISSNQFVPYIKYNNTRSWDTYNDYTSLRTIKYEKNKIINLIFNFRYYVYTKNINKIIQILNWFIYIKCVNYLTFFLKYLKKRVAITEYHNIIDILINNMDKTEKDYIWSNDDYNDSEYECVPMSIIYYKWFLSQINTYFMIA